ncbi:MAG: peptide-methionine (S)-S-oxide reductase [Verrucomicrobiales bacterium]|jgi:peptide-methionine (S)-S-oxide reductase
MLPTSKWFYLCIAGLTLSLSGCTSADRKSVPSVIEHTSAGGSIAYFAGGCFWCVESDFEGVTGVSEAISGYAGGALENPTYKNHGDHTEVVEVRYDPSQVTYEQLVDTFWRTIDPFAVDRQFCDAGRSYRSAIFYSNAEEQRIAESSKKAVEKQFGKSVATEITGLTAFWMAEEYHQDYHTRNVIRYAYYRNACGRDARVKEIWSDEAGGLSDHYK